MDQLLEKIKLSVSEGCSIGRLSVGPLVFNIRDHPLFVETPISYIRQGRLRECTCVCGQVKLISEKSLESGRVLSCGCLKRERSILAAQRKLEGVQSSEDKRKLSLEIRSEQARLKYYNTQYPKDQAKIDELCNRIKELMLRRLKTVDFKKNAKQRLRYAERKLLNDAGIANPSSHHVTEEQPK